MAQPVLLSPSLVDSGCECQAVYATITISKFDTVNFYNAMESFLSASTWYMSCTKKGLKVLRVISVVQKKKITETKRPSADEMYKAQQTF